MSEISDIPTRERMRDHGGDIHAHAGAPVLRDFSASINPLGQPQGLLEHLTERWTETMHYPDRSVGLLKKSLADHYNIGGEHLLVGNGSTELIDLTVRALKPKRVVLSPPDFGLYTEVTPPEDSTSARGVTPSIMGMLR